MSMKRFVAGVCALAILTIPRVAAAQSEGLATLVSDLILRGIVLPGASDPGRPHAGHFTLGNPTFGGSQAASRPDLAAIGAVEAFADRFRGQFANFPLGSSSGGFTYTFDESTGAYARASNSFGPSFTERATTLGRGKVSVGFNYQRSTFDSFGGEDLREGDITFYLPHTDCCSAAAPPPSGQIPGFEGDLVEAALDLKATTDTFAAFVVFGVTDRLDLGVSVPLSRVKLDANVQATIIRLASADTPLVHTFVEGQDVAQATFSESGEASGIGDIVVRTKYNFARGGNLGLSAALDLRLPTGDEENLLGLGTTQAKVFLIASGGNDTFAPHLNVGFTVSGDGPREGTLVFTPLPVSNEFNYAGGIEVVAHPRVTLIGDILGRTLIDAGKLEEEDKSYLYRVGSAAGATAPLLTSTTNPLTGEHYRQLSLSSGNLNLLLGAAGVKFNAATNFLISGNVLFPLSKTGLRDNLTIAVGFDYAF
jgi:hypothetical protein